MCHTRKRFDYFSEAETPKAGADWQSMYPSYLVPSEGTAESDNARFWFANTMHFSRGCHPFDSIAAEGVYLGLGLYSSRIFVLPMSLGLDVRIVNGYVYQSTTPVEDPEEIARRAVHFQERAGYYYDNWDALYEKWKGKMLESLEKINGISFPALPNIEPLEVVMESRGISTSWSIIENYHSLINEYFRIWQYHFEFLNLGYGAYITFFTFCKDVFPQIDDQSIAKMVAGVDSLAFRPDEELIRLSYLAHKLDLSGVIGVNRDPSDILDDMKKTPNGRTWLEEFEISREPWFNYATGYGFSHDEGTWNTKLEIPFQSISQYVEKLAAGEDISRPTERLCTERDELVSDYRSLLNQDEAEQFDQLVALSHKVFPYIEEHTIYVEHWSLSAFWKKMWELADFLQTSGFTQKRDDIFFLNRFEIDQVLSDVVQSWAIGVPPRSKLSWEKEVLRRRDVFAALQAEVPVPAYGTPPEEVTDPFAVMNFGITTERVKAWLGQSEDESSLTGIPASQGIVEGAARVLRSEEDLHLLRKGEILVAPITAPSWASAFSVATAVVTDTGGMMCHAAIVCREYGIPAVVGTGFATARLKTGQKIRVNGNTGEINLLENT